MIRETYNNMHKTINMKKTILIFTIIFSFLNVYGQSHESFNVFIGKFIDFDLPLNPTNFFISLTGNNKIKKITQKEYDIYLRTKDDKFWKFNNQFEYCFGGKKKFEKFWLVFYRRDFLPDDLDKVVGEIKLLTIDFSGKIISDIIVSGGYGDSITINSKIDTFDNIEINYTKYSNNNSKTNFIKRYTIQKDGKFKLK